MEHIDLSRLADFAIELLGCDHSIFLPISDGILASLTITLTHLDVSGPLNMGFEYAGSVLNVIMPASACIALQSLTVSFPFLSLTFSNHELRVVCQTWSRLRSLCIPCTLDGQSWPFCFSDIMDAIPHGSPLASLHIPTIDTSIKGNDFHLHRTGLEALSCDRLVLAHHSLDVASALTNAGLTTISHTPQKWNDHGKWVDLYKLGAWIRGGNWDMVLEWHERTSIGQGAIATP